MDGNKKTSISKADTDEGIGEFWDSHDFTDFDDDSPDVALEVAFAVPLEVELFGAIEREARKRGITVETLVNLWLQQKLIEQA
jgi:hypothetical protein